MGLKNFGWILRVNKNSLLVGAHYVWIYLHFLWGIHAMCESWKKGCGMSMNFHDILYSKNCNAHELIDSRCLQMEIFTHKVFCQCVIINTHEFNCK